MDSTFSFFHPPVDASADEVRGRLATLKTLIDRAPVPIAIAHDPDCRYISGNEALARLLGLPPDANISLTPPEGQEPFYRIQRDGEDIPSTELPMQYAIANRTHVRNDIEIVRRDGTVLYVQNDVEPLYDSAGHVGLRPRHTVPPASSVTMSAPSCATATPTGRPQTLR